MHRWLMAALLIFILVGEAAPAAAAPRCFPETGYCIEGRIAEFWQRQGGLPVFGYPLGPAETQPVEGSASIMVQRFERARIELHPNLRPPYDIQLGRLGAATLALRNEPPAPPEQPRAGCAFFAETGLNICPPFLAAWRRYGLDLGQPGITSAESLALFGLPLTPPRPEQLADGRVYTVQWFERARFEDHGAQGVLFGLLGGETRQPAAIAPSVESPFVTVAGTLLTLNNQPVQLKGVNYYPQGLPWRAFWQYWNAPQIERELRLARDQLGINTIRILVPYELKEESRDSGRVTPELIRELREFLQIAGSLDMRVIVTLFDFDDGFPLPNTREEERNIAYLETLLGHFVGDDRIIAWDLHNEPDHYDTWKNGEPERVLLWMGRMADQIRRLAPNHLITVGMGQYENFYRPGPDGRRPIDYIDVISLHNYNAADMARQIAELRAHSDKPIIIGEFGWPSGPRCVTPNYTEAEQERAYAEALRQASGKVAGVIAWTLRDYDPGPSTRYDTREEHYGLFRADDTLKPAAAALRAYPAAPLPSLVKTDLPLTAEAPPGSGSPNAAQAVDGSPFHIKGPIRRAWEYFNGRHSFGLPLGEAFVRDPREGEKTPVIVQYFEAAVLEAPLGFNVPPDYDPQLARDLVRRMVRVVPHGPGFAAANGAELSGERYEVASVFRSFYREVEGRWRFGDPLSELHTETIGGTERAVQYFERGRLEVNPAGIVEASRAGTWAFTGLCAANGQP